MIKSEIKVPSHITHVLEEKSRTGNLRHIPSGDIATMPRIDLVSNDYLSLAERADRGEFDALRERVAREYAFSSSASRLLSRRQRGYMELERLLGSLYDRPALLFNSGYHANVGIVSALNAGNTLFVVDRLVHASVYDGLRVGGCLFERFRHNDMASLRKILEKHAGTHDTVVVIAESVYSMDGDLAPLRELVALREEFGNMLLYVDEAHAVGVRGSRGLGLAEETGTIGKIDIITGTFGKALASSGAFTVCDSRLHDFFVNCSRSFIFSTAIPPVCAEWTREMLLLSLEMERERRHLAELSQWFAESLALITGNDTGSRSQIIPLVTGDAQKAVALSECIHKAGFDALAIRRPTVPPHGERIRFSLSAGLTRSQLEPLLTILKDTLG